MDEYTPGFCIRSSHGRAAAAAATATATTGTKCGRWNPTSEQVKVLTELFRSGLRTPSTDQIQKISLELSFYGKIESKNVFYWFQNHKARERQKRRRVLLDDGDNYANHHDSCNNNKFPSTMKHGGEISSISEARVTETLQLFPLNSNNFRESDHSEKLRILHRDNYKENSSFTCNISADQFDHPTLDLRLSFV